MTTMTRVRRVLVADDVTDLRMLVRMALEGTGDFDVVAEAADGAEAIAQAEKHQPDLVVLDLSMPVLDGLEALPGILSVAPEARVVVLSGFDAAKMRDQVLAAGAVAYIEKGDILAAVDILRDID
jgi:DNA-binding NarL/FixJ family response regulator